MKSNKFKYLLWLVLATIALLLIFSPFRYDSKDEVYKLENEIIISQPVEKVFQYLGNSSNAAHWSVFVDHITPLNPQLHQDGSVGAQRRCFKNSNEKGIYWDETILENIPNTRRTLSIYNLNGFPVSTPNLTTMQKYQELSNGGTSLVFGLYKNSNEVNAFEWLKIKLAGYAVASVFKANLKGIKYQTENQ